MRVHEYEIEVPANLRAGSIIDHLRREVTGRLPVGAIPVRFSIVASNRHLFRCEVGVVVGAEPARARQLGSVFDFRKRGSRRDPGFHVVHLIPTGIGAEIGGHAGDANPVATLLAATGDRLITHPNVVNASDLNELPENGWYVEGSIITRLLMGTAALLARRSNRVLALVNHHENTRFTDVAVNAVNAARATFGLTCPEVVFLDPPLRMKYERSTSGRSVGYVEGFDSVLEAMDRHQGHYDAVALATGIEVGKDDYEAYYRSDGDVLNPWGGVEAMLTHTLSSLYDVPTAHAPIDDTDEAMTYIPGLIDPRMAAEVISDSYFLCTLKGLQRSPMIITDIAAPGTISAADLDCLVIPDKAIGLPTLAALEHGIPVIAVRENRTIMDNDLTDLPWAPDQLHVVDDYFAATGVITALRIGIDPHSITRPLESVPVDHRKTQIHREPLTAAGV